MCHQVSWTCICTFLHSTNVYSFYQMLRLVYSGHFKAKFIQKILLQRKFTHTRKHTLKLFARFLQWATVQCGRNVVKWKDCVKFNEFTKKSLAAHCHQIWHLTFLIRWKLSVETFSKVTITKCINVACVSWCVLFASIFHSLFCWC